MQQHFRQRMSHFEKEKNSLISRSNRLSSIRLMIFILFVVLQIWFVRSQEYAYVFLAGVAFLFAYLPLVIRHRRLKEGIAEMDILAAINRQEVDRLEGNLKDLDPGTRFYSLHHPYAKDLDIFGDGSLFQLLDRCSTESGQRRLAHALTAAKEWDEIDEYQKAVKEIGPEIDFRQHMHMLGKKSRLEEQAQCQLVDWFASPEDVLSWQKRTRRQVILANGFTLSVIVGVFFFISWQWLLVPLVMNSYLLRIHRKKVRAVMEHTEKNTSFLQNLSRLLQNLERKEFNAKRLISIKNTLTINGLTSSMLVKSLAFRFEMLEYTRNPYFYLLANGTFLWELHWMTSIERWRLLVRPHVEQWIAALNEYEVMASFAGAAYANPDWIFPNIKNDRFCYVAKSLGHPLIFSSNRVTNDFAICQPGETWVLTGSNMSGKSTFLRTLGLNAVLALAGAPVCAKTMEISPMRVFSSMRTEDNLQESTSSFYAELKRLKQLLDYLNEDTPVFYLLDEILKGTNSADRQAGSKALIRNLQDQNASGIIATHDLELGALHSIYPQTVFNYSFNSSVQDGELYFDYKLHKGVCHSFNATELMKKIGIEIRPEDRC